MPKEPGSEIFIKRGTREPFRSIEPLHSVQRLGADYAVNVYTSEPERIQSKLDDLRGLTGDRFAAERPRNGS